MSRGHVAHRGEVPGVGRVVMVRVPVIPVALAAPMLSNLSATVPVAVSAGFTPVVKRRCRAAGQLRCPAR